MTDPQRQLIAELRKSANAGNYYFCSYETGGYEPADDKMRALLAMIEEQDAVIQKLPVTADGVPIVPGMEVWHAGTAWSDKGDYAINFYKRPSTGDWECEFTLCSILASKCYSTREAAQAAAARGDEGNLLSEQRKGEKEQG